MSAADAFESAVHIRQKALRRGYHVTRDTYWNQRGSDPQGKTLCDAPSTTQDMSWAETRYPKDRAYVTCEACLSLRLADDKVVVARG